MHTLSSLKMVLCDDLSQEENATSVEEAARYDDIHHIYLCNYFQYENSIQLFSSVSDEPTINLRHFLILILIIFLQYNNRLRMQRRQDKENRQASSTTVIDDVSFLSQEIV